MEKTRRCMETKAGSGSLRNVTNSGAYVVGWYLPSLWYGTGDR
jgi:hypothetical protein